MIEYCHKNNQIRFKRMYKGAGHNVLIGYSNVVKNYERSIICIQEGEKIYKIISVSATKKDGSLNIFFPYCKEKESYIYQFRHKYKAGEQRVKKDEIKKEYMVDSSTKLSIHNTGFVQLSGNGIKSGIDNNTGEPKGVGIFSSPLSAPVSSGPTFIFQCWNLDNGFDLLDNHKNNVQYIIFNKDNGDFRKRENDLYPNEGMYILEFFVFPENANEYVYEYCDEPYIDHISNCTDCYGQSISYPVLDISNFNGVLCVFPIVAYGKYIRNNSRTGYILSSPGGSGNSKDKSGTGEMFHLICPREYPFENLDRLELKL